MGFWLGEGGNGLGTPVTKWEQFWREDSILNLNCLWISVCVCVCVCMPALLKGGPAPLLWILLYLQHPHVGLAQSPYPGSVHHGAKSQRRDPTEGLAPANGLSWVQASNGAGALDTHPCVVSSPSPPLPT